MRRPLPLPLESNVRPTTYTVEALVEVVGRTFDSSGSGRGRRIVTVKIAYLDQKGVWGHAPSLQGWIAFHVRTKGDAVLDPVRILPESEDLELSAVGADHYEGTITLSLNFNASAELEEILDAVEIAPHLGSTYDTFGPGRNTVLPIQDP